MHDIGNRKFVPADVLEIADLLDFFLEKHPAALLIFLGKAKFPTIEELHEMVKCSMRPSADSAELGVLIQGGPEVPEAQRIVEGVERIDRGIRMVGGIERIIEAFRTLRRESPREFAILRDSIRIRKGRPYLSMDLTARKIAERHAMHEDTMRRNRNYILVKLAHEIAFPGLGDLWRDYADA